LAWGDDWTETETLVADQSGSAEVNPKILAFLKPVDLAKDDSELTNEAEATAPARRACQRGPVPWYVGLED